MKTKADTVVRFSGRARLEHACVMALFIVLALTGFPQKFFPAPWSRSFVGLLGGIDRMRWLHRAAGTMFSVLFAVHVAGAVWPALRRKAALSLVPEARDFRDAADMLRYQLGAAAQPPAFDRFDYRQKFEYWGLLLGGAAMVATGLLLLYPLLATIVLGGQFVPAARAGAGAGGAPRPVPALARVRDGGPSPGGPGRGGPPPAPLPAGPAARRGRCR